MQHLTEEELVSHYYHDADGHEHLVRCEECRAQYEIISRVLTLVNEAPVPERGDDYGTEVWTLLRWKLSSGRQAPSPVVPIRSHWRPLAAIAAMLALAFFAGQFWRERTPTAPLVAAKPTGAAPAGGSSRILLVVLSDHLDTSERVLMEVANADPGNPVVFAEQQQRAEDLVSANRMYRQVADKGGDDRVASLLSDLEPVLVEIAKADSSEKLAQLQKRIEARGLLFKVRVLNAQVSGTDSL